MEKQNAYQTRIDLAADIYWRLLCLRRFAYLAVQSVASVASGAAAVGVVAPAVGTSRVYESVSVRTSYGALPEKFVRRVRSRVVGVELRTRGREMAPLAARTQQAARDGRRLNDLRAALHCARLAWRGQFSVAPPPRLLSAPTCAPFARLLRGRSASSAACKPLAPPRIASLRRRGFERHTLRAPTLPARFPFRGCGDVGGGGCGATRFGSSCCRPSRRRQVSAGGGQFCACARQLLPRHRQKEAAPRVLPPPEATAANAIPP